MSPYLRTADLRLHLIHGRAGLGFITGHHAHTHSTHRGHMRSWVRQNSIEVMTCQACRIAVFEVEKNGP